MPPLPKLSPLASRLLDSGLGAGNVAAAAAVPAASVAARKRLKLWELEDKYHCPVVGTCVPMAELLRLARRFQFAAPRNDHYALHSEAVGCSRTRNEFSEALHRHLDRAYEAWIERFAPLKTDAEVRSRWQECLENGEVAGPMWAALTHKAGSPETRHAVFADIHMLSHQIGAGQAADSRRLGHLEQENAEFKAALEEERRQHGHEAAQLREQIAALQAERAQQQALAAEADHLRARLAHFESGQAMVEMGQRLVSLQYANDQLRGAAQRVWELDKSLRGAREESGRLARERDTLARERDTLAGEREALERLLLAIDGSPDPTACSGECQNCDAANTHRCILYVGGRPALVSQYRALVERLGIRLIHHDGGLEEALSRLPEMIHGADAVVCPTDCVSHSAYYHLKKHCKRAGKPCLFFRGAGISSFAMAMARLAGGDFSLAGQEEASPA